METINLFETTIQWVGEGYFTSTTRKSFSDVQAVASYTLKMGMTQFNLCGQGVWIDNPEGKYLGTWGEVETKVLSTKPLAKVQIARLAAM